MVLDNNGNVKWDYQLPSELNKHYTVNDIANFTRWYLDDYPVFCQTKDYGLFVIGLPKGSLWKYNFYSTPSLLRSMVHNLPVVVLVLCFHGFFDWGFEVKSVDNVEVEVVCSQTAESTVDFSHDGRTGKSALIEINFGGDDYFVTCDVLL